MDQLKNHLSGPLSGLCWNFLPFLEDMAFRYCPSAKDLPVLRLSFTCPILSNFLKKNTVHHDEKFSGKSSLGITLLAQNYYFMDGLALACFGDLAKEMATKYILFHVFCDRLLTANCLKI